MYGTSESFSTKLSMKDWFDLDCNLVRVWSFGGETDFCPLRRNVPHEQCESGGKSKKGVRGIASYTAMSRL